MLVFYGFFSFFFLHILMSNAISISNDVRVVTSGAAKPSGAPGNFAVLLGFALQLLIYYIYIMMKTTNYSSVSCKFERILLLYPALLPVSKAHAYKFYIFRQCTDIVFILQYQTVQNNCQIV